MVVCALSNSMHQLNICSTEALEVHDQAKFGFLLCKIFRGSWYNTLSRAAWFTIFAETKKHSNIKMQWLTFSW